MAVACESQEKIWRAIDGKSKKLQDLVQGNADTNEEEDIEMVLVSVNPPKERLVLEATVSVAPQSTEQVASLVLAPSFFTIERGV